MASVRTFYNCWIGHAYLRDRLYAQGKWRSGMSEDLQSGVYYRSNTGCRFYRGQIHDINCYCII